jgi:hypothetical protein
LETYALIAHPDHAPIEMAILIDVERAGDEIVITYRLHARRAPVIPPVATGRADGLWRTTCFELFTRNADGPGYREFNFSPSGQWAAYGFGGYRDGMAELTLAREPSVTSESAGGLLIVTARLPASALLDGPISLSAVIEDAAGGNSYWALAHPPGAPDFHAPACFAASLAAPLAP